jgi:pimeloyl-ACP methyl ester carboxylesterase
METSRTTTVLLHGAGAGPWIWDRVIARLNGPAVAPEYPGRLAGATPETCADDIMTQLDRAGIRDAVLVLHSLAGVLAAPLASRLGARLKHLVPVSAVVPSPGRTFAQTMEFPARLVLPLLFRLNPKGLMPSPRMIRDELCGDLSPEDADAIVERHAAEWPGLYLTPASKLPDGVPMTSVILTGDRSVPPKLQRDIANRLGISRTHELDAGHLAMLSRPEELARLIDRAALEHVNGNPSFERIPS